MKDYLMFTGLTIAVFVAFYFIALKQSEQDIKDIAILAGTAATAKQSVDGIITGASDLVNLIKTL